MQKAKSPGHNLATINAILSPSAGHTINGAASFTMNQNNQRVLVKKIPGEARFVALA